MTRTCEVSGDECLAPAGYQVGGLGGAIGENHSHATKATCFACGLPVCVKCSRIRVWFRYGRKRVCENCDEDDLKWRSP